MHHVFGLGLFVQTVGQDLSNPSQRKIHSIPTAGDTYPPLSST